MADKKDEEKQAKTTKRKTSVKKETKKTTTKKEPEQMEITELTEEVSDNTKKPTKKTSTKKTSTKKTSTKKTSTKKTSTKKTSTKKTTSSKKATKKTGKKAEEKEDTKVEDSIKEKEATQKIEDDKEAENLADKQGEKTPRRTHKSGTTKKESEVEESSDTKTDKAEKTEAKPPKKKETKASLKKLTHEELLERSDKLRIPHNDTDGLSKDELVDLVYKYVSEAEGYKEVIGILDILSDGYGFLRCKDYMPSDEDIYVSVSTIRKNGLRKGDQVKGKTKPPREGERYAAVNELIAVNEIPIKDFVKRPRFADLTPIFPDERLTMEHGKEAITARVMDLVSPIGKGQRGLIVSPPKAGKTTVLKDIAASISANNPEVHLMCLLVDERPEEVTDMERSIKGEVISSTFDMPCENHIAIAELTIERAKRLVESGRDVVILLDSITRLARAYNLGQPASGRVLSGGVDSTALYPPKRFLGAARNIENGGSLTILASALIETGSKMDEVIFEEFKGTGNMELKLDRNLADRRIFPAIDPITSGTRREDLLIDSDLAPFVWGIRQILADVKSTEKSMSMLINSLKKTKNNNEFLMLSAKKARKNNF